jgi:hypothetical protein
LDRHTYKLAQMLKKREKLVADLAQHDNALNTQLRAWSDTRPGARGGGIATIAGATFLLRQAGALD